MKPKIQTGDEVIVTLANGMEATGRISELTVMPDVPERRASPFERSKLDRMAEFGDIIITIKVTSRTCQIPDENAG